MKELLQQALDALEDAIGLHVNWDDTHAETITALREALAAPMPEPWKPEWAAFLEYWTHEGHLQTFADRERFRAAAKAMLAAPPAAPAPVVPADQWKQAIDDELICCHIGTTESFPDAKAALKNLIDWHVSVALDPAVSSDAQALIDKGKSAAPVVREPLDDQRIEELMRDAIAPEWFDEGTLPWHMGMDCRKFARAIERAHGIGGGGK